MRNRREVDITKGIVSMIDEVFISVNVYNMSWGLAWGYTLAQLFIDDINI